MKTLSDRVLEKRSEKGWSQADLANEITRRGHPITQTAIDKIEKRPTKRPRCLPEMAKALGVSEKWLLSGKNRQISDRRELGIPEIDVRGGMGGGGVAKTMNTQDEFGNQVQTDDTKGYWGIPDNFIRGDLRSSPKYIKIIEVMGDSMSPTLTSGDRVLIDTAHVTPSPPGIYSLWDGYGVIVKRVELVTNSDPVAIRVISDNEHHSTETMELDGANIIGRVICRVSVL